MEIKQRYQITLEVYEHKTVIHCGFMSDTVMGVTHEEKAKDLIPFIIREMDMIKDAEEQRQKQEKKCFDIAKRFMKNKKGATLRVVK